MCIVKRIIFYCENGGAQKTKSLNGDVWWGKFGYWEEEVTQVQCSGNEELTEQMQIDKNVLIQKGRSEASKSCKIESVW